MARLEEYPVWYRDRKIKRSLGWLSPTDRRRKLGFAETSKKSYVPPPDWRGNLVFDSNAPVLS